MRYSDRPISKPSDDLFERSGFAWTLSRAIDHLSIASDGFVIALLGEWGSGKTSVIQLVRRYLQHIEMARASEEPLAWETQAVPQTVEQLEALSVQFEQVEGFIADLEAMNKDVVRWGRDGRWQELKRRLQSDEAANAADRYWQLKLAVEANPRTIVVAFSPWVISGRAELTSALLSELARALGKRFGENFNQAIGALLQRLSEFAPVAGAGLDLATHGFGGSILRASGTWSGQIAKRMISGPTLDKVREDLRKILANLNNQRILVIIDDLDRLTPTEALEVVSVIKSLGDLPNVIYLLSYDERKLSELIDQTMRGQGREFLEKIVQYSVRVPPVDSDALSRMLDVDLSELLGDLPPDDSRRLNYAWHYVLSAYLRTPRHVRRYINSLAISQPALSEFTDGVDLLVLECLRLYDTGLYEQIREHLMELVD